MDVLLGRSRSRRIKTSSTVIHPPPLLLPGLCGEKLLSGQMDLRTNTVPAIKILSLLFPGKSRFGEDRHIELQVQQQAGSLQCTMQVCTSSSRWRTRQCTLGRAAIGLSICSLETLWLSSVKERKMCYGARTDRYMSLKIFDSYYSL